MHEHAAGRAHFRPHQHCGPEQRVEVQNVLADEVIQLGVAVRAEIALEPLLAFFAGVAQIAEAGHVAHRRIQPHVEILAFLARYLKAEIRLVAGDIPVLQPLREPFGQLVAGAAVEIAGLHPPLEQRLEFAQLEELVLGFAGNRRAAAQDGTRIDQFGGRVGGAAGRATVAVLVLRPARWTLAAHKAVGQKHARFFVVGLLYRARADETAFHQPGVDALHQRLVLRRMRGVVVVEADSERLEVPHMCRPAGLGERLRAHAFLARLEHGGRTMRIGGANEGALGAGKPLVAHPDIGLHHLQQIAEVNPAAGVG